jgi:hypothetical protein
MANIVRRVQRKSEASLLGRTVNVSKASQDKHIAFRPAEDVRDGVYEAWFRYQKIKTIGLTAHEEQDQKVFAMSPYRCSRRLRSEHPRVGIRNVST